MRRRLTDTACCQGSDKRTIEISYLNPSRLPCEVRYGTGVGRHSKWGSKSTPGVCESIASRIRRNLQHSGFRCVALAGGKQPAGTVEAERELSDVEIVQAANVALDKCVTELRTMGAGCADQPFAFKVVDRVETPMAIGGADVPVFFVEARYDSGSRRQAQGFRSCRKMIHGSTAWLTSVRRSPFCAERKISTTTAEPRLWSLRQIQPARVSGTHRLL